METISQFGSFNSRTESWTLYSERLEQFFIVTKVTDDDMKRAQLLTFIGAETYAILRSIVSPVSPKDLTFKALQDALTKHFNPVPSEIIQRYKFNMRERKPNESIATYIAELRTMSEFCNYGQVLDDMLRDRLVCGCRDDALQKKLLSEANLTLAKAIQIAQAMESANRHLQDIKGHTATVTTENVNAISILHRKRRPRGKRNHHMGAQQTDAQKKLPYKPQEKQLPKCNRCNDPGHSSSQCPFRDSTCHACSKQGHIARACRSSRTHKANTNQICHNDPIHDAFPEYETMDPSINHIRTRSNKPKDKSVIPIERSTMETFHMLQDQSRRNSKLPAPYKITVTMDNQLFEMEVDTGSAYSLLPSNKVRDLLKTHDLKPFDTKLTSFSGHEVDVAGVIYPIVSYKQERAQLPLVIYCGQGPTLCGRTWTSSKLPILQQGVTPQTLQVLQVNQKTQLDTVLDKHETLFDGQLGCLKDIEVHLHQKTNVLPKFHKARSVPYALKDKVEEELLRLEDQGIITQIPFAKFATPIVPVMKPNGKVRICGDFSVTTNTIIDADKYPLPKAEDIFAKMAGCKIFTRIDMKDAYSQLKLDKESRKLTAINTTKGLFEYNRLPFGISSASAIFQKHMEILLINHKTVSPYQDDILLGGIDDQDHLDKLDKLLTTLQEAGLKLQKDKCKFMESSLDFLGYHLDKEGLHPQQSKLKAIMEAPEPLNLEELRSFIGLLNYYSKFIPNQATALSPLYDLMKKSTKWTWTPEHSRSYAEAKKLLAKSRFLTHFNPKNDIRLACDASPKGIGAVISHVIDGSEFPIAFASRTLAPAETNYSQLEREALSLIFGVTKFRDYLLGRKFTLVTDHQPLIHLLSEKKPIPQMAAARLQRWALTLSAYRYTIEYKKGILHSNADALSRLPLQAAPGEVILPVESVLLIRHLESGPITAKHLQREMKNDYVLTIVMQQLKNGWKSQYTTGVFEIYYKRRSELSTLEDLLLMGRRVIVPEFLRKTMLENLHETHQGIVKMKAIARSTFWWPRLDMEVEDVARKCEICQALAPDPSKTFIPWPVPAHPWQRVHMDFSGPIEGKMLFIVIDAHSKWIECEAVSSTTTEAVIRSLRPMIARFGIMNTLVFDNATCFTSSEFAAFTKQYGINHLTIAPHHPQSNGQAERTVSIVKGALKKISGGTSTETQILEIGLEVFKKGTLEERLSKILMRYRRTPLSKGKSPSELLIGRNIVTTIDVCHPRSSIYNYQDEITTRNQKRFEVGKEVYVRNFNQGPKWIPGIISKSIGNNMYEVESGGRSQRKHENQLRAKFTNHDHEATRKRNEPLADNHIERQLTPDIMDQSKAPYVISRRPATTESQPLIQPQTQSVPEPCQYQSCMRNHHTNPESRADQVQGPQQIKTNRDQKSLVNDNQH